MERGSHRGILVTETHLASSSGSNLAASRTAGREAPDQEFQRFKGQEQEKLSSETESETRNCGVRRRSSGLRTSSYFTRVEPKEDS